jgi:uncharacterized membrane protein YhaH (DUF805 family)
MKMKWTELLFSFKGRIQRLYFWITSLVVGVVAGMLNGTLEFAAQSTGNGAIDPDTNAFAPTGPYAVALVVVALVNMWISFALCVKRLHDRDRTGWWLVVQAVAILVAIIPLVVALTLQEEQRQPWYIASAVVGAAVFVFTLWLFVEIGILRGTKGPNGYGPDPLGDASSQTPSDAKL